MDFETQKYIYTAFDGRIILRADIDRPLRNSGRRHEYLSSLSNGCIDFAAQKLKLSLDKAYKNSYVSNMRYIPYNYSFKIKATYSDDVYLSLLMLSSIRRGTDVLLGKCESVIFKNDTILPQQMIAKKHKRDFCIIISENGIPVKASYQKGEISTQNIDKYVFPI